MKRRLELLVGGVVLIALLAVVAALGVRQRATADADRRPSSLLALPGGTSALADALGRTGTDVRRHRTPGYRALAADTARRRALAVLDPTIPLTPGAVEDILELPDDGLALILAGGGARPLLRCFGYDTLTIRGPAPATGPGTDATGNAEVRAALRLTGVAVVVDSTGRFDTGIRTCEVPAIARVDTLAMTAYGPAAVRLVLAEGETDVVLASDVDLFRNRTLRETGAGPMVLGWLAGRYDRVWFDELHHGFLSGGSLAEWTLRWSQASPVGWFAWHLAIVGLLALLARMPRFGPPLAVIDRRRRSVVEHVEALAVALRAAGGHRHAIGLLVSGLRRRLAPGGRAEDGDWSAWLGRLQRGDVRPGVAEAAGRLAALDRPNPTEADVVAAGTMVEDLWKEIRK